MTQSSGEASLLVPECTVAKHRAGDSEESVDDCSKRAGMRMTAGAKRGICSCAFRIMLAGDVRPVKTGVAEADAAGLAHEDERAVPRVLLLALLTGLLRDGSCPTEKTKA